MCARTRPARHLYSVDHAPPVSSTDRNLFDPSKLKAKTKISKSNILELHYADNCALVYDSVESLRHVLNKMTDPFR